MRKLHDRYFKQAKRDGYLARSIYKLEEINRRNRVFGRGDRVLDLGACPGSWLEYILPTVGAGGATCAVDIQPIHKKFKKLGVHFVLQDIRELDPAVFAAAAPEGFDAVVSDMAPKTSGIKAADQLRSLELCEAAWLCAQKALKRGGNFVCKVLEGPDYTPWRNGLKPRFKASKTFKPDASRDESMETYFIGIGFDLPSTKSGDR